MPRHQQDDIDIMCHAWARIRRGIHGIDQFMGRHKPDCPHATDDPDRFAAICGCMSPSERIGKLKCTLGRVKEEREGAHGAGVVQQGWAEVYSGMSLLVHRAWYECPEREWMLVMDAQYVWREIPVKVKAAEIGISEPDYWRMMPPLKSHVRTYVKLAKVVDEFRPVWTPSHTFVRSFVEAPRVPDLVVID